MSKRKRPVKKRARAKEKSPFPKLRWNQYSWNGEIQLPAWRGFQVSQGPFLSLRRKKRSTGKVRLDVSTRDDEKVAPTLEQERAYRYLLEQQQAIRDVLLKAIRKAYPKMRAVWSDFFDESMFADQPELPKKFANDEELKSHIGLSGIYMQAKSKGGSAYIGYAFQCSWDIEHGLGVAAHGKRVLEIGQADVAFMSVCYNEDEPAGKKNRRGVPDELKREDLITAVREGNRPWVEALLKAGAVADKRYQGPRTVTAIEVAMEEPLADILKLLLKWAKRSPNPELMTRAARGGKVAVAKVFEENGLRPTLSDLTEAITHRHHKFVEYLLSLGLRPDNKGVRRAAGIVPRSLVGVPQTFDRKMLKLLKRAGVRSPDAQTAKILASI